eukprot:652417-Hanusia_phi.AAC.3
MAKGEAKSLRDLSSKTSLLSIPSIWISRRRSDQRMLQKFLTAMSVYGPVRAELPREGGSVFHPPPLSLWPNQISTEEQNMATGADPQGKSLKNVQQSVMSVLQVRDEECGGSRHNIVFTCTTGSEHLRERQVATDPHLHHLTGGTE